MPRSFSAVDPIDPQATPEARALLRFLQSANGRRTLSGQHNYFSAPQLSSDRVKTVTGIAPLMWGCEWGFSDARHATDDIAYRPRVLAEMKARHEAGHVVVLTWHQASPTVGEPCLFEGGVKMNLPENAWRDILTEGTSLHDVWCEQVDVLAAGLRTLSEARVPVVFRPYHEMNGNWFWWGARPGLRDYEQLWRQLQQRILHHHGLHNLLWAWCCDRPWEGVEAYWPGHDAVDLVGTDIYPLEGRPEVYPQEWYNRMAALAQGKPLALTENSVLPSDDQLTRQPWSWFMGWVDLLFEANSEDEIRRAYANPRVASLGDVRRGSG